MKSMIMAVVLMIAMCSVSFAGDKVLLVPKDCKTIQSATYSTGGGDKMFVYAKIHCLMENGDEVLFLAKEASISGAFGWGRWTMPKRIFIKRYSGKVAKWQ